MDDYLLAEYSIEALIFGDVAVPALTPLGASWGGWFASWGVIEKKITKQLMAIDTVTSNVNRDMLGSNPTLNNKNVEVI